jgi:hypothetical protein
MRVAVIYRPKDPPPLEAMPMLMGALGEWVQKHGPRFSTIEFFVGGGGFGVIDLDDSGELQRLMAENPFTPFSEVEVRPVLDPATAMQITGEAFAARARAAGGPDGACWARRSAAPTRPSPFAARTGAPGSLPWRRRRSRSPRR